MGLVWYLYLSEPPYKLPENWCWTRIGNYVDYVTDYVANGSFASLKVNVSIFKDENYALMVKTRDFANGFTKSLTYTDKHGYDFLSKSTLHGGELILSNIGSVGKVFRVPYFDRPMTLASNSVMVKCYNSRDYDWMYYFLLSPIGFEELKSITTGTAVPKFNKTDLKTIPLPVPPLAEQQRIVDRIESLFAKLDEAKEKAQVVVDSFETRKAAILHKAFTGELTAKWREEHGVGMESWRTISFKDVCKKITDGTHHSPINTENGEYMYITAKNIKENGIDLTNITFVSKDVHEEIYSRCDVQYGDVLYIKDGATTGIATVNTIDKPFSLLSSVAVLRPDKKQILAEYMAYNLNSSKTKTMMISSMSGNAITRLTLSKIKAASITICSLDEQEEIVRLIDHLLGKEQQTKEAAEIVLDQIELMKKSILARAFRGELGTNDPSEESAVKLLKQII